MTTPQDNVHGTAIVIGTRGLLFVGPSGSGKSDTAFTCLALARAKGAYAALVADDQVFITRNAKTVIAHRPPAISGLLELRYCGIAHVESTDKAVLDLIIELADPRTDARLPDTLSHGMPHLLRGVPVCRLRPGMSEPLAAISVLHPDFQSEVPF